MTSDIKELAYTVLASGAFFTLVQFLINRHDNKKNVEKKLSAQIDGVRTELGKEINEIKTDVKEVSEGLEEHRAVLARTHILRFADELRIGKHSKEYFLQQLQDIKTYDHYCKTHPDFENNLTVMSSEFIQEEYKRLYLSNDTD